jgi:hypothetical protein
LRGKRLQIAKVELGDLNAVERLQVLEGGAHSIPREASSGGVVGSGGRATTGQVSWPQGEGRGLDGYVLLHEECKLQRRGPSSALEGAPLWEALCLCYLPVRVTGNGQSL